MKRTLLTFLFLFLFISSGVVVADDVDNSLADGLSYLVANQQADGSFAPNEFGRRFRRGITGLGALALMNSGDDVHLTGARRSLQYLADHERVANMYSHAYASLALVEGALLWNDEFRRPAERAVATIVRSQNANGGWGYGAQPTSSRTETCMSGIMLHVLFIARQAEFDVPDETVERALEFLHGQFNEQQGRFNNETYPSPSYGATAMGVAGLLHWGEHESGSISIALEYLQGLPQERITANLRGRPFSGYARGMYHFELTAHAIALYFAQDQDLLSNWLPSVQEQLIGQAAEDGSWDGWFGKCYGTALVCLVLQLDAEPCLTWFDRPMAQ